MLSPGNPLATSFRQDIQGLRGIAVLLVVLYHARVPGFTGGYIGVDVFFVISGYLITSILLKELATTGHISLATFYARRIRRLLPAALFVTLVTTCLFAIVMAPYEIRQLASTAIATVMYVVNIQFAINTTDYMHGGDLSPLLHMWSLAVEEQFYLVWPVLILVLGRLKRPATAALVMLALAALSLALCILLTRHRLPWAFFLPVTRAWEFCAGGLLSMLIFHRGHLITLTTMISNGLVVAGIAVLAACALIFDETTRFPGWIAIVPVLASCLLILAGVTPGTGLSRWLMASPPLRFVGDLSYSWYLWHWPMVVGVLFFWPEAGTWALTGAVAMALLAAWATFHTLENYFRAKPGSLLVHRNVFRLAGSLSAVALIFVVFLRYDSQLEMEQPAQVQFQYAMNDKARVFRDDCHYLYYEVELKEGCDYGDLEHSSHRIVLFGDSHAAHWFPALMPVAQARGASLTSWTKAACPSVDISLHNMQLGRMYEECDQWRERVFADIKTRHTDLVVIANASIYFGGLENWNPEQAARWREGLQRTIERIDAPVVVIHDVPQAPMSVPVCLSRSLNAINKSLTGSADEACAFVPQDDHSLLDLETSVVAQFPGKAWLINLSNTVCPSDKCEPKVDGVVKYFDDHHLTETFAASLTTILDNKLLPALKTSTLGAL